MEKLRFAIQVLAFTMALPVYFYVELNHDTTEQQQIANSKATVEVNYTKNGKDRTPHEAVNGTLNNNPLPLTASTKAK